jgi:anti-sigma B factor antagonist
MGTHSADDSRSRVVDFQARRSPEPAPPVSVGVSRFGDWTVVDVAGELDIQAVALFADLSHGNSDHVVFQLQGVSFMDACGLGLLLECRRRAVAAGGCVRLVAPSRQAQRLLMLTGSYRACPTFESVLEAVTAPVAAVPHEVS